MALVNKMDSNITGLRYAVESSLGVLPGLPVWKPMEPNSYNDFGGQLTTRSRQPINPSRQNKKGVVVDLDASGGLVQDLTQTNMQDLLQGFFFADFRERMDTQPFNGTAVVITAVDGANDEYEAAAGLDGFNENDLVFASGFLNADNNGLKLVTNVSAAALEVAQSLLAEPVPPTAARLVNVGYQFNEAEVEIDVSGSLPRLLNSTLVAATSTLVFSGNVSDGDEVEIGDVTYVFETGAIDAPYKVDVGGTAEETRDNLIHAIMGTGTPGVTYGEGTLPHPLVNATPVSTDSITVTAKLAGAQGNAIVVTSTGANMDNFDNDGTLQNGVGRNLAELGCIPGEWIFLGGDTASTRFTSAANNGFKRVKSVAADGSYIEFDKSFLPMEAGVGTGLTIQLFYGRVLKNETGDLIKRRSYQFERTLGAPDDAQPTQLQAEYLVGSVASQFQMNLATAEILTTELSFVATDNDQRLASEGLKPGLRPPLVESDAFNTTSDFARIKLAQVVPGDEAPAPLFAYATDATITVNNNLSPNKAISVLGAFDITAGTFQVNGSLEVYFTTVEAVQAVRNNADITLDFHLVKAGAGVSIDLPLLTLGDGRANIELDQPIKLPLSFDAATAAKLDPAMDHTMLMVFYDYLPALAH